MLFDIINLGDKVKKIFVLLLIISAGIIVWKKDEVSQFIVQKVIFKDKFELETPNNYYKTEEFLLFENQKELTVKNKDDFNNFLYTILNSGWTSFSFFCDFKYTDCINDFTQYITTSDYVEVINNYVHPFNSFDKIVVTPNNFNKITIKIEKLYSTEHELIINQIIDNFIKQSITDDMNDRKKIKLFHDWIINQTKYDKNFTAATDKEAYPYHPYSAYGPLVEGMAVCSGYSDVMAIFLDKIGIKNYKISNVLSDNPDEGHVWNYAFVDGKWYHLDLTWDDPLVEGNDMLIYDFFLINTDQLEKINTSKHTFNKNYYLETKTAN